MCYPENTSAHLSLRVRQRRVKASFKWRSLSRSRTTQSKSETHHHFYSLCNTLKEHSHYWEMRCAVFPLWVGVHFAFPLRCISGLMWFFSPDTSPFQQMLVYFFSCLFEFFETPPTFSLTFFMPRFFVSHRRRQTEADSCSLWGWENTKMKSSVCVCVRAFRSELLCCNKGVRSATETRRICRIQLGKLWMTFWLSVVEQRWLCIAFSMLHSLTGYICNKELNMQKYRWIHFATLDPKTCDEHM